MVTLLNCIERIPSLIMKVLKEQDQMFADFVSQYGEKMVQIEELVFIGSGTSSTASITAQPFVEKVSGLETRLLYPNVCAAEGTVFQDRALYIFLSQTGTSTVVCEVMQKLIKSGYHCISLTDSPDSDLAKLSPCHICLNCGKEEYGMRTIGYTISVLDLMLLGLRIGLMKGNISEKEYEDHLQDALLVPDSLQQIIQQSHIFYKKNQRRLMRSQCIIFTGARELYGLSLEAAVKFWEMPQVISIGYELEEGMHGPNYGYDTPHCVIVFNNGSPEEQKGLALARYMKDIFHNGLVIGTDTVDEDDLKLDIQSKYFAVLEYSAVPQVLAYDLTIDGGRDLLTPPDHSVMYSYFSTHTHW